KAISLTKATPPSGSAARPTARTRRVCTAAAPGGRRPGLAAQAASQARTAASTLCLRSGSDSATQALVEGQRARRRGGRVHRPLDAAAGRRTVAIAQRRIVVQRDQRVG